MSEPEDLSKFDFLNFAEIKFQNGETCKFARAPLSTPLLSCDNDDDRMVRFLAFSIMSVINIIS